MYLSVDARMGERYYCPTCKNWYRTKFDSSIPAGVGWVPNFFMILKYAVTNAKDGTLNHSDIPNVQIVAIINWEQNQEAHWANDLENIW